MNHYSLVTSLKVLKQNALGLCNAFKWLCLLSFPNCWISAQQNVLLYFDMLLITLFTDYLTCNTNSNNNNLKCSKEPIRGNESDWSQLGTIVNRSFVSNVLLWRNGTGVIGEYVTWLKFSRGSGVSLDCLGIISYMICRKHPQWQAFTSPRNPESMRRCWLNTSVDQSASSDAWKRYEPIIQ